MVQCRKSRDKNDGPEQHVMLEMNGIAQAFCAVTFSHAVD